MQPDSNNICYITFTLWKKCFNDGGFHGNITHTDMCKTIQAYNSIIADCVNAICVYYSVRRMLELLKLQNPTAIFAYPTPWPYLGDLSKWMLGMQNKRGTTLNVIVLSCAGSCWFLRRYISHGLRDKNVGGISSVWWNLVKKLAQEFSYALLPLNKLPSHYVNLRNHQFTAAEWLATKPLLQLSMITN